MCGKCVVCVWEGEEGEGGGTASVVLAIVPALWNIAARSGSGIKFGWFQSRLRPSRNSKLIC